MQNKNWYTKTIEQTLNDLKSNINGLETKEASNRLKKYGINELPHKKSDSIFKIFFRQIIDPIVLLLLVSMSVSFIIGETVDAIAILFIVTVDLILGAYQEWNANKTAESLSKMIQVKSKVLRDKNEVELDSNKLALGDIVILESGDKISADLRIIECSNLTVDESSLTGESLSICKTNDKLGENTILAERKNMLYAGTNVLTGRAKAIVVATGRYTEIGKIAGKVAETKEAKSPLTIRMEKFSKQITLSIIVISVIIAILLYSKGTPGTEIFLAVIALSVSAMPEGLPLALTMALTIASNRMSKKNVVVKRLNAVESLGSCTVIASDKTGTLTVNEQTAKKIVLPNNDTFEITGSGYNANGEVLPIEKAKIEEAKFLAKQAVLNNEASLVKKNKKYEHFGDSIDVAFLSLGMKLNLECSRENIVDSIPYESENKYSAVFYKENKKYIATAKGSVEKILSFCSNSKVGNKKTKLDKKEIQKQNEALAKQGYRVIAICEKEITKDELEKKKLEKMNFIGLVAFIDPIREEVKDSIKECKTAGIKVVMITGDHPLTAFSIAKDLGLVNDMNEVTTGSEIDEYLKKGEKEFDEFIKDKKVFTRVTPLNKLEIVESYKRQGEFVAVTGDGVNDAPALKTANIGIAMGSGTDVAKETAAMIVLDDNFKSIVSGIKEGRNAYSNIRKVSYMLLSCGVAEVLFFILAVAFDLPMPLVAVQLLWLNLVTDGLQDFALSFEKAEKNILKEKPRNPKENLFNPELCDEILLSGLVMGCLVFIVWFYLMKSNINVSLSRGYVMTLMVFIQNMHVLNSRSEKQSTFKIPLKTNPLIAFTIISAIALQIIVSEVPIFSKYLKTTSLPVSHMLTLFVLSTIIILIMEIYKFIKYNKKAS